MKIDNKIRGSIACRDIVVTEDYIYFFSELYNVFWKLNKHTNKLAFIDFPEEKNRLTVISFIRNDDSVLFVPHGGRHILNYSISEDKISVVKDAFTEDEKNSAIKFLNGFLYNGKYYLIGYGFRFIYIIDDLNNCDSHKKINIEYEGVLSGHGNFSVFEDKLYMLTEDMSSMIVFSLKNNTYSIIKMSILKLSGQLAGIDITRDMLIAVDTDGVEKTFSLSDYSPQNTTRISNWNKLYYDRIVSVDGKCFYFSKNGKIYYKTNDDTKLYELQFDMNMDYVINIDEYFGSTFWLIKQIDRLIYFCNNLSGDLYVLNTDSLSADRIRMEFDDDILKKFEHTAFNIYGLRLHTEVENEWSLFDLDDFIEHI